MLGFGTNGTIAALLTPISALRRDIHQRYAAWVYRQALLSLGGSALAEQAVGDVIADESALATGRGAVARRSPAGAPPVAE